jgi:hypothetical protein
VREKKAASCHWGDSLTSSHQPRREAEEEEAPEKKEEASRSLIPLPFLTQQKDSSHPAQGLALLFSQVRLRPAPPLTDLREEQEDEKARWGHPSVRVEFCAWFVAVWLARLGPGDSQREYETHTWEAI